jgi:hypothetical protein
VVRELAEVVVQRNRELRSVREELATARASGEEEMRSLVALGRQLEEIRAQARGQATQIRMRALRDAAKLMERVSAAAKPAGPAASRGGEAVDEAPREASESWGSPIAAAHRARTNGVFEGAVDVDVGPLRDFSQLVALEDAAGAIGATSEISITRFSRGRATLAMNLSEPVELLRELEERCDLEFRVRSRGDDRLVLDVDEDQ